MSGYRRVNYYELCRLCTSSEGAKMNIFLEEGRRRQLQTKIQNYLPVQVSITLSSVLYVCLRCVCAGAAFVVVFLLFSTCCSDHAFWSSIALMLVYASHLLFEKR